MRPPNTKSITYNVREETITLAGDAKLIEIVKGLLQQKMSEIVEKGGSKYSLDKQCSPEPVSVSSPPAYPRTQGGDNEEPSLKVFAIRPKDHSDEVRIWMNSILPVLPGILHPGLGKNYAACLVRRGESEFSAVPCIQIESPHRPGPENRESIEEALYKLWYENGGPRNLSFQFTMGRLMKLFQELENDTKEEDSDHRLHFNLNRPHTKPGMGASVGLISSPSVSATLGGYILINGQIFILTTDHFIERSQMTGNSGLMSGDQKTLVSPSLGNLAQMVGCLEQTKRDHNATTKSDLLKRSGDRDIPASELRDRVPVSERDAVRQRDRNLDKLLDQVQKPYEYYTLGKVIRRSQGPRKASDSHPYGQGHMRYMDWAICEVNHERVGENRHKYRSNDDAKADDYIDIDGSNLRHGLGDICHETCDIIPGEDIFYVGQTSGHRMGIVNGVPMQVSIESDVTVEWSILDSRRQSIELRSVQGDSGAWVLRKCDNKLMGQVIAHSLGQVLFTPIKDIFADIQQRVDFVVSLPTVQRSSGDTAIHTPAMISADLICSEQINPRIRTYHWLTEDNASKSTPDTGVSTSTTSSKMPDEISRGIEDDIDNGFSISRRGPVSSLPSLTSSPASPVLTSPTTPPRFQAPNISDQQLDETKAWAELSESMVGFVENIEDQEPPKASESKTLKKTDSKIAGDYFQKAAIEIFENSLAFSFQEKKWSGRSSTWPVPSPKKLTRARRHIPSTPYIARSVVGIKSLLLKSQDSSKPFVRILGFCSQRTKL